MKKNARIFLTDILGCIDKIEAYTKSIGKEKFMADTEVQDAVMHRIEIIGEATKNIPADFKNSHPDAPWSEMARTRDKLIHGYFEVNAERVWFIVKDDLPEARVKIQRILQDIAKEEKQG